MFEMFATIVAACAAAIYGLSRSVFMSGVHRNLYRAAFIGIIILVYVTYRIYHYIKFKNIKKLNVDFDDYLYYDKYTLPGRIFYQLSRTEYSLWLYIHEEKLQLL